MFYILQKFKPFVLCLGKIKIRKATTAFRHWVGLLEHKKILLSAIFWKY